jgi:hypothetical protein
MYAYAKVIIERPDVRALPRVALSHSGEKTYCWRYEDGRAVKTEIQTGVSDGEWTEVTNRLVTTPKTATAAAGETWTPFDGSEQLILDEQSILTDGLVVEVEPAERDTKVTGPAPKTAQPATAGKAEKVVRIP